MSRSIESDPTTGRLPDEFDPDRAFISMDSPLGKALLGRAEGDEFSFRRPKGEATLTILSIRYAPEA